MTQTTIEFTKTGKMLIKNKSGVSRWWKQIDTNAIVSPTNAKYSFYIIGELDTYTGKWRFEYVSTDSNYRSALSELTNPVEAKKWYERQK